ncbi:hypothetical protein HispidOSU_006066, partial [Sigmodon hispidus]
SSLVEQADLDRVTYHNRDEVICVRLRTPYSERIRMTNEDTYTLVAYGAPAQCTATQRPLRARLPVLTSWTILDKC